MLYKSARRRREAPQLSILESVSDQVRPALQAPIEQLHGDEPFTEKIFSDKKGRSLPQASAKMEIIPLQCYVLVGGVVLLLAYAALIGDPPWPPQLHFNTC